MDDGMTAATWCTPLSLVLLYCLLAIVMVQSQLLVPSAVFVSKAVWQQQSVTFPGMSLCYYSCLSSLHTMQHCVCMSAVVAFVCA